MTTFILTATILAAPPPMPDPGGGWITLWLDNKPVKFRGNGKDVTPVEQAIDPSFYPYGPQLTPDGKSLYVVDKSPKRNGLAEPVGRGQANRRISWGRLVIGPLDGKGDLYILPGYVLTSIVSSAERDKLYFRGVEGEKYDPEKPPLAKYWTFDFATKKVSPFTPLLPEKHRLAAVGKEGKTILTTRTVDDPTKYSHRTYWISPNGIPKEILKENTFLSEPRISPDGSKVFGIAMTFKGDKPSGGIETHTFNVVDLATGKVTELTGSPKTGRSGSWIWSADSTSVAFVWSDPEKEFRFEQKEGAVRPEKIFTYKVFCYAADGTGCREIFKDEGQSYSMLDWR